MENMIYNTFICHKYVCKVFIHPFSLFSSYRELYSRWWVSNRKMSSFQCVVSVPRWSELFRRAILCLGVQIILVRSPAGFFGYYWKRTAVIHVLVSFSSRYPAYQNFSWRHSFPVGFFTCSGVLTSRYGTVPTHSVSVRAIILVAS